MQITFKKAWYINSPIAGVFVGLSFMVLGVLFIVAFGNLTILQCNRLEPKSVACDLTSTSILNDHHVPIPAGALQRAVVDVQVDNDDDGGRSYTYQVKLITTTEIIPFTYYSMGNEEAIRAQAQQINAFLTNSEQQTLTVQQDNRLVMYMIGGLLLLFGAGAALWSLR